MRARIPYPGCSVGEGPKAMLSHRRGASTHREAGIRDPRGGFPSAPAALRGACGGVAPRRIALLAGELGKPSYVYHMLDSIH